MAHSGLRSERIRIPRGGGRFQDVTVRGGICEREKRGMGRRETGGRGRECRRTEGRGRKEKGEEKWRKMKAGGLGSRRREANLQTGREVNGREENWREEKGK